MRTALFASLAAALLGAAPAVAVAQEHITVHPKVEPGPGGEPGEVIQFKPLNNPNFLDYGPLPDNPGADKSQDYEAQAGGDFPDIAGPGSDNDADVMPDNDMAPPGP